jgi:hypothetical protein
MRVRNNGYVITKEQEEEMFSCESCQEMHILSVCTVTNQGECICDSCRDEYYRYCESCETTACRDTFVEVDYNTNRGYDSICESCSEEEPWGNWCVDCDNVMCHDDQWNETREEYYCRSCEPQSCIRNYSYRPHFHYDKLSYENADYEPYLGIELEVSTDDPDVVAENVEYTMGDDIYFKHDASCGGFEIVSHPATFGYHKKNKWRDKLTALSDEGAESYQNGDCGIHVHVSKNVLKPKDWHKIVMFTYKCKVDIKTFCQRAGKYSYCKYHHWSNYGTDVMQYPSNSSIGRYSAINFTSSTVEFRMFRGTLQMERFWSSLEFVHSMVSFARNHGFAFFKRSERDVLWQAYINHLEKENVYQTILKHFSRRGLRPQKEIKVDQNGQTFIAVPVSYNNAPISTRIEQNNQ